MAGVVASLGATGVLAAQDTTATRRPALWSVELDLGARLPGLVYDEFVERRSSVDSLPLRTRYRERGELGIQGRLTLHLRPEAGLGAYVSLLRGYTGTVARFSGGREPREDIPRSVTFFGVETGLAMRLSEWADGRGSFQYQFGPVFYRQVFDLSPGHRDALASFGDVRPPEGGFRWTSRTSTSWGIALGAGFRIPLGERTAFRFALRDLVVPVNTSQLEAQERDEIRALSGHSPVLLYNGFTAHHASVSIGVEYTLAHARPRARYQARLPSAVVDEPAVAPAVANAVRIANAGDTATAIAALEQRISFAPDDAYAWRELSVLLAARAVNVPDQRPRAVELLQRALALNPGDAALLRAYGRLRAIMERQAPAGPEPPAAEVVRLSDLALEADRTGELRLAWAIHDLAPEGGEGPYRYRTEIEVFRGDAEPVAVRAFGGDFRVTEKTALVGDGTADLLPVAVRATLFLPDPRSGIYTARVRVTDLVTSLSAETSAGFELREP